MNTHKRVAIALLGGLAIAGIAGASAASLGGLNSDSLGSDDDVVASCDTAGGVTVAYTTVYNATDDRYDVTAVEVGGVDAPCNGLDADATLRDSAGAVLSSGGALAATGSFTITLDDPVSAEEVEGISLVITG